MAVGEDALVAVGGCGVAGVPEGFDEGGEGEVGAALEVGACINLPAKDHLTLRRAVDGVWGRRTVVDAIVGQ